MMNQKIISLFAYEQEALLSSLRRDLRAESAKCQLDASNRDYHAMNVKLILRILEVLSPKGKSRHELGGHTQSDLTCK